MDTKERQRIKESFSRIKQDISNLAEVISYLKDNISEIKRGIKLKEKPQERFANYSANYSAKGSRTTPQENFKSSEKKVLKGINKIKLMNSIQTLIDEGHNTTYIKEEITERFNIKKTCFFKYYKLVRKRFANYSANYSAKGSREPINP